MEEVHKRRLTDQELINTIKTYEDVCKELGEYELIRSDFDSIPSEYRDKALNYCKLQQILRLFNGDWVADWNNLNQYKYYPWFEKRSGGWFFDSSGVRGSGAGGVLGVYRTQDISDHCGKAFIDIYISLIE